MHTRSQSHWRPGPFAPNTDSLLLSHKLHPQHVNIWHLYTAAQVGGREDCSTGKLASAVFGGLRVLKINGFFSLCCVPKINVVSVCHELTQIVVLWLFKAQHLPSRSRLSPAFPFNKIKQSGPSVYILESCELEIPIRPAWLTFCPSATRFWNLIDSHCVSNTSLGLLRESEENLKQSHITGKSHAVVMHSSF